MSERFELPRLGPPTVVRFPEVRRDVLSNGLRLWTIPQDDMPVVTAALIVEGGTATDPAHLPGLASLVADLADEGAGGRDAIQLADTLARLGSLLEVEAGPDVTTISITTIAKNLLPALSLAADVVIRPHLGEPDLTRVRELRLSRLRQLSSVPAAAADRAFLGAVFGDHPYGHGALGTSASLEAIALDDAREFWHRQVVPARSTLVIVGGMSDAEAEAAALETFGAWTSASPAGSESDAGVARPDPRLLVVDRPDAPQSEVRVGHLGPSRATGEYHALLTLNAVLGGQFTSRINRNLRETRGITYGARTSFDMRRRGGTFTCETSVQADRTAEAVTEVLAEMRAIQRDQAVVGEELHAAKASLTRGYVRHFETAAHLLRAAAQLVTYDLDEDTFDRFVPFIEAVGPDDLTRVAQAFLQPDDATIVVVGDVARIGPALADVGREIVSVTPEF
jgi:zinc protease